MRFNPATRPAELPRGYVRPSEYVQMSFRPPPRSVSKKPIFRVKIRLDPLGAGTTAERERGDRGHLLLRLNWKLVPYYSEPTNAVSVPSEPVPLNTPRGYSLPTASTSS